MDESQVNSTVEAVGFDFIKQPLVECTYKSAEHENVPVAEVHIDTFKSEALAKGAALKGNLETLAMVLVDLDYPFDKAQGTDDPSPPFKLDLTFYAASLEKEDWVIRIPLDQVGEYIMFIYIDIYGNEYTEVKQWAEFEFTKPTLATINPAGGSVAGSQARTVAKVRPTSPHNERGRGA